MTVILQNSGLSGWSNVPWDDLAMTTLADGTYIVTGTLNGSIVARHFSADGNSLGDQFTIETTAATNDSAPAVTALADGGFVVTWTAGSGDSDSSAAVLSQRFDSAGARIGATVKVNATTAGTQNASGVTGLDGGGYVVTWTSNGQDGAGAGIYSRLYDAAGQAVGGEVRVNTYVTGDQSGAYVTALSSGGYIVTWTSNGQDGAGNGVYAQTYDASGHAIGGETRINTTLDGNQTVSSITGLEDGGYIIAWTSDASAWYQRYDLHGAAVGGETLLYSGGRPGEAMPIVRGLSDGGFVIRWQVSEHAGFQDRYSIHTQRFDSTGARIGGEGATDDDVYSPGSFGVTALHDGGIASESSFGLPDIAQSVLAASAGTDGGYHTLYGTGGNDDIHGTPGIDSAFGGAGNDTLTANDQPVAANYDPSGKSGDRLYGDGGDDTLVGGNLANRLDGGAGADIMSGGAGDDTYYVDNANDVVNEADGQGNDYVYSTLSYTLTAGSVIENLILSGSGNINAIGNELDNILTGNSGNNLIDGGAGNDELYGGLGVDTLDGGAGQDRFVYDASLSGFGVLFDMAGFDTATGVTLGNGTVVRNVEAVAFSGSNGDDTVNGGAGDDILAAGNGKDMLNGNAGNDSFFVDTGYKGTATIDGGAGLDEVTFFNQGGGNLVLDGAAAATAAGVTLANGVVLRNVERFFILTLGGNDILTGGAGNDTFNADNGTDVIDGGAGDDLITVDGWNDTIAGGAGNDRLVANMWLWNAPAITAGFDANGNYVIQPTGLSATQASGIEAVQLSAGNGNDTLAGGAGDDVFKGSDGNDVLTGGAGNDSLTGDNGDDLFAGGLGADTLTGGFGNDTYDVDNAGDVVIELDGQGIDTLRTVFTTTLTTIENLTLTGNAAVNGTGNAAANILVGNASANTLTGLGGNDLLDGGAGADWLDGGLGDDTYVLDNLGDVIIEAAGQGTDLVQSAVTVILAPTLENLTLTGNASLNGTGNGFANLLTGNAAANILTGLGGNDLLNGGAGADSLIGGVGNDTYVVDNAGDVVVEAGGAGTDVVNAWINYSLGGNVERLNLMGTANIAGTGNGLDNQVTGNSGNNKLDGGIGADTLIGGLGNDSYYIENAGDKAAEAANEGIDQVYASINFTLGSNVENLQLTGSASNGTGNGLNNVIWGTDGANLLDGKAGADKMLGGLGDDTYYVDNSSDQVTDVAGGGVDTVVSSQSHILSQYVENLVLTGFGNITATGNAMDNVLLGNYGNNRITGGLGADEMDGSAGNDTYYVDNTGDVVVELVNYGVDLVQSTVSFTLSDNVENLYLNGSENLNGTGNALNNLITGTSGNNVLDGKAGVDKLFGGLGDDTYYLDNASDSAKDELNGGHDVVYSSASWVATTNIEDLFLTGSANITGTGNALNNTLSGNGGNNKLDGGTGNDTLTGGAGSDVFLFNANSGQDTITDFTTADTINLKAYSHGTAFGGGITVTQDGGDVLIDLGGGNTVNVSNSLRSDVVSHIGW